MADATAENQAPFTVNCVGEETGQTWAGNFSTKLRLTHRDHIVKDRRRREILGGEHPETAGERAVNLAFLVSELEVRLVKFPTWWEAHGFGIDFEDDKVLGEVYDGMVKAVKAYQDERKAKADEAAKAVRKDLGQPA